MIHGNKGHGTPSSSLGIVLVDILEESNSATELLRFLGHMTRFFRGARSSFGSSSFCIRDRTRCHYWRRVTCRSFVFHELVRGRGFGSSIARGIFALPLVGQIDWSANWWAFAFELADPIFAQSIETSAVVV
ncbi:hypothetical protein F2Q69_00041737 [Brassica cretica]|uniref:Uncharacterized protein n=1 Tax=Brassica cretica TaxID=69181 RepID=A0A8S9NLD9_BRACR|nr:hypothetical protein F2Q69_00041737 [Brassica cretica]